MSPQGFNVFPCVCIPETNGIVLTAAGERSTVRRENNSIDISGVSDEGIYMSPCVYVPQTDRIIFTRAGKKAAIITEGYIKDTR